MWLPVSAWSAHRKFVRVISGIVRATADMGRAAIAVTVDVAEEA